MIIRNPFTGSPMYDTEHGLIVPVPERYEPVQPLIGVDFIVSEPVDPPPRRQPGLVFHPDAFELVTKGLDTDPE